MSFQLVLSSEIGSHFIFHRSPGSLIPTRIQSVRTGVFDPPVLESPHSNASHFMLRQSFESRFDFLERYKCVLSISDVFRSFRRRRGTPRGRYVSIARILLGAQLFRYSSHMIINSTLDFSAKKHFFEKTFFLRHMSSLKFTYTEYELLTRPNKKVRAISSCHIHSLQGVLTVALG